MPPINGALPELVYQYPTAQDNPTQLRPIIILDWSVDVDTAQFSNSVSRVGLVTLLDRSTGQSVATDYLDYDSRNRRIRLQASSLLSPNQEYRLIIAKGVQDTYGRRSQYHYDWTFTTAVSAVSSVLLVSPSDGSTQSSFPTFTWAVVTGATGINYQFQLASEVSFTSPLVNTLVNPNYYTPGSIPPDQESYYWRVRAVTASVTGEWSDTWAFYYGTTLAADVTSRTTWIDPVFALFRVGNKSASQRELGTNLSTWPTLSFTFTSPPVSSIGNYVTVTKKAVLPRNDQPSDYVESTVAGTWSVAGSTATFTPTDSLAGNSRYLITFPETLVNTQGVELGVEQSYYVVGQYTPYYVDIRVLKAKLRTESLTLPDDQINLFIHLASLEANMRYQAFLLGTSLYWYPDSLTETMVRGVAMKGHAVLRWVEARTRVYIYESILSDEIRNVGRTTRLSDYQETLTKDFLAAIKMAKDYAEEEMMEWENFLSPSDTPMMVSRHSLWDSRYWYGDLMVGDVDAGREDRF